MMRAAWWWIDRWRKSTAYTDMSPEQRGMYRDLLDEVWLRKEHTIPDDDLILGRIVGDPDAWKRQRETILHHFRRVEGGWTNDTALEVIGKSLQLSEKRSAAGRKGNEVRWAEHRKEIASAIANPIANASSPSPSLTLDREIRLDSQQAGEAVVRAADELPALPPADQAERAIRRSTDTLRTKLYKLVTELGELDPQHRDATEIMRTVTCYRRSDGQTVRGVVNPSLLTHERLERSIEDAEFLLNKWTDQGNGKGRKV
jgi:uncharacterized protein YdaU (DUF1376 family)